MQDKHLFEYAVIRVVPKVEREEFLNVGLVLYCRKQKYLDVRFFVDASRLQCFGPGLDIGEVNGYLQAFEKICRGEKDGGPIAGLDLSARFRWLTATRSTIVQTSKVHPGFCDGLPEKLEQLFTQLVLLPPAQST